MLSGFPPPPLPCPHPPCCAHTGLLSTPWAQKLIPALFCSSSVWNARSSIFAWLTALYHSSLISIVTSIERSSLTTKSKLMLPLILQPGTSTSSAVFSSSYLSSYETVIFISQMLSIPSLSPSKRTNTWPVLFITVSLMPRGERAHNRWSVNNFWVRINKN